MVRVEWKHMIGVLTGLGAGLCPDPLLFLPQLLEPCLTTGSSSPMGGPVLPSITQFLMLL